MQPYGMTETFNSYCRKTFEQSRLKKIFIHQFKQYGSYRTFAGIQISTE